MGRAYPVLNLYDMIDVKEHNVTKYKVDAILVAEFYWRDLMKDILPDSSKGIILVTENSCTPQTPFTYQLNGPQVQWLGVGDFHNTIYSSLTVQSDLFNLNTYHSPDNDGSLYTGVPVDQDDCLYRFHVYPSDELKQRAFMYY
jgi:hypothetical protein